MWDQNVYSLQALASSVHCQRVCEAKVEQLLAHSNRNSFLAGIVSSLKGMFGSSAPAELAICCER